MQSVRRWLGWAAAWAMAGLVSALLLWWLRPDLIGQAAGPAGAPAPAAEVAASSTTTPAAASPAATAVEPAAATAPLAQPAASDAGFVSYAEAVERSAPAVVNIYTERVVQVPRVRGLPRELAPYFGDLWNSYRERVQRSLGSGVIYDDAGHVVTNYHVVDGATQIRVQLRDGREAPARVVGSDRDTDLAVLKVELGSLPSMTLGRSDRLRVGDPVLAIGNPMGLGQTVTQGIVSATGRARLGVSTFENFIQTDAAINFGNSGGALIDARGELVGINTAVIARNSGIEGIGFAIPVDLVRGVVDAILREGRVVRGWIGIQPQSLTAEECRQFGWPEGAVIVAGVYRGMPAATEGVRRGDVITEINGSAVTGAEDVLARIAMQAPGQPVRLTIRRGPPFDGQPREHTVRVPVIERPPQAAATS